MVSKIYCDESGFTGNDLLNPEQPIFVYSSVAMDNVEAAAILQEARTKYRLKGEEIKGSALLSTSKGQDAANFILDRALHKALVSVHHKRYAAACKLFEYLIEPIIAENNYFFYSIGFNRFISTLFYLECVCKIESTARAMPLFTSLMRTRDQNELKVLLNGSGVIYEQSIFNKLLPLMICHRDKISKEISSLGAHDLQSRWVLELTGTALFRILCTWGERNGQLAVFCDQSAPVELAKQFLDSQVNNNDKKYLRFRGQEFRVTFNLLHPIETVDSKLNPAVQIADVIASAVRFSLEKPDELFSSRMQSRGLDVYDDASIFPDLDDVDLSQKEPFLNGLILEEILHRTLRGDDLLSGLPEKYLFYSQQYDQNPPSLADAP